MESFSRLISTPAQKTERILKDMYVKIYQEVISMFLMNAKSNFQEELVFVKDIIAKRGEFVVSEGCGNLLINSRYTNPNTGDRPAKIEAEGVREAVILWLWDMGNLERIFLTRGSGWMVEACFLGARRQGMTSEPADIQTRKVYPIFGASYDESIASGMGRPLPIKLKN